MTAIGIWKPSMAWGLPATARVRSPAALGGCGAQRQVAAVMSSLPMTDR